MTRHQRRRAEEGGPIPERVFLFGQHAVTPKKQYGTLEIVAERSLRTTTSSEDLTNTKEMAMVISGAHSGTEPTLSSWFPQAGTHDSETQGRKKEEREREKAAQERRRRNRKKRDRQKSEGGKSPLQTNQEEQLKTDEARKTRSH